jgi:hypothetical protein
LGRKSEVYVIEMMEHQLRVELLGIEWIALLYWSFIAASWLEQV